MRNKLLFGVGVYEKGRHKASQDGVLTDSYIKLRSMLQRCYDAKYHSKQPTYKECEVCGDWLHYQNFAEWYESNYPTDGFDYVLDKDLKLVGNKLYSPDTCMFVTRQINAFIKDHKASSGEYLIGVCWCKVAGKFKAQCSDPFNKKRGYLGLFEKELEAHYAWRRRKSEYAHRLAMTQSNKEVKEALLRWRDALDNGDVHQLSHIGDAVN